MIGHLLLLFSATGLAPAEVANCAWRSEDFREFRRSGQNGYIEIDRFVVRPGMEIGIASKWSDGPFGQKELPIQCLTNWRVSNSKHLKVSRDRTTILVGNDAVPGQFYWVSASFHGRKFTTTFRVTGRDEQVLVGKWTQTDATGCGNGGRRVAELAFSEDGRFSYTFPDMMFETMTSGGGRYQWDTAKQVLELNGQVAKATLDGDTLRIEGYTFDPVAPEIIGIEPGTDRAILAPQQVCRLSFQPIGTR